MENKKTIYNWREYETASCPDCCSINVAKILYGKPIWSDEIKAKIDSGEISLGGCIVAPEYPIYKCNECDKTWGQLIDDDMLGKIFRRKKKTNQLSLAQKRDKNNGEN